MAGKSLVHNIVQVVDADEKVAAPGIVGEIVMEGPTVMKEYWRRPEETAVALRDGFLWTGNSGYVRTMKDFYGYSAAVSM